MGGSGFMKQDEIDSLLDSYHVQTLTAMAEWAGMDLFLRGQKMRRAQLVAMLRADFFTKDRVQASWNILDEREQAVLNRLLLREKQVTLKSFRREILRAGLASRTPEVARDRRQGNPIPYAEGYVGRPDRVASTVFEDLIARLTVRGLVFSRAAASSMGGVPFKVRAHPAAILYVPQAVRRHLPEPRPIPVGAPTLTPESVRRVDPTPLLRDLYLYWDAVRRNEVTLIQSGLVGKRWLKAINQVLLLPDPALKEARGEKETGRLYMLRQLLQLLRLVDRRGRRLIAAGQDTASPPEFWSLSPAEQVRACLDAWAQLSGPVGSDVDEARYNPRYALARGVILSALKDLPAGTWIEPADFVERVQNADINFLFADHSDVEAHRGQWYHQYGSAYYSERTKDLLKAFEKSEVRFVRGALTGFLFEIGVVELGYAGGEWIALRLKRELSSAGPEAVGGDGKVIVQPNFQVMAMGPVRLSLLARLDLFADRESVDQSVFEYRLTRESVYRAQGLGIETAEIIQLLTDASDVPLPQNVRRSLEEWAAHHERIVFRTGVTLLQAADAGLLDRLAEDTGIGGFLARRLSAEVAMVDTRSRRRLIDALVDWGQLPAVSGAEPEAADKSVLVGGDGTIRPIHAVPSLHLRGRLARLADRSDDGTWRLTPASVARFGGSKNKVLRILDELGKLHRGVLPGELIEQIKGWGGYFGDAAVETLTLVEFRDRATLDELRRHADLKSVLLPFPAGNRALAVVPRDELDRVRESLARLGVQIRDGIGKGDL